MEVVDPSPRSTYTAQAYYCIFVAGAARTRMMAHTRMVLAHIVDADGRHMIREIVVDILLPARLRILVQGAHTHRHTLGLLEAHCNGNVGVVSMDDSGLERKRIRDVGDAQGDGSRPPGMDDRHSGLWNKLVHNRVQQKAAEFLADRYGVAVLHIFCSEIDSCWNLDHVRHVQRSYICNIDSLAFAVRGVGLCGVGVPVFVRDLQHQELDWIDRHAGSHHT